MTRHVLILRFADREDVGGRLPDFLIAHHLAPGRHADAVLLSTVGYRLEYTRGVEIAPCEIDAALAICAVAMREGLSRNHPEDYASAFYQDTYAPLGVFLPLGQTRPSVAMWLSQTWHRHGANVTDAPRNGVIVQYARSWVKPFADFRSNG